MKGKSTFFFFKNKNNPVGVFSLPLEVFTDVFCQLKHVLLRCSTLLGKPLSQIIVPCWLK